MVDRLLDDAGQGCGLTQERELPGLGLRQLLQVGHQPAEEHGFFVEVVHQGVIRRHQVVAGRLQIAAQVGQWGAQLVCDVGDHVAAQLLLLRQAAGHRVERVGQLSDLVLGSDRHAHGEIALFHALGSLSQAFDRAEDAARQRQCDGHGGQAGDQRADEDRAVDGRQERGVRLSPRRTLGRDKAHPRASHRKRARPRAAATSLVDRSCRSVCDRSQQQSCDSHRQRRPAGRSSGPVARPRTGHRPSSWFCRRSGPGRRRGVCRPRGRAART